jgi:hypothetical protein
MPAPPAPITSTSLSSRIIARTRREKTAGTASVSSVFDCRALYADPRVETMQQAVLRKAFSRVRRPPFTRCLLDHAGYLMQY